VGVGNLVKPGMPMMLLPIPDL